MIRLLTATAAAALLLTACGQKEAKPADNVAGPVVAAPSQPINDAVDTTPTAVETNATAGASSFTEGQARGAIEKAGYTNVGPLSQNANGVWQGKASKGGAEVTVAIDYTGAITQP